VAASSRDLIFVGYEYHTNSSWSSLQISSKYRTIWEKYYLPCIIIFYLSNYVKKGKIWKNRGRKKIDFISHIF